MKVAIVHEMLIKLGGAERVLQGLIRMYPEADVFTLMYDEIKVGSDFPKAKIHCTGPAQWLFRLTKKPRASLPLMPFSIRMVDVLGYDLVISSSSGFAHGVKANGKHICYCHSPARYLWDWSENIQKELGVSDENGGGISFIKKYFLGSMVKLLFWWLRKVDIKASKSPDLYIANSREVQARIKKYYRRDSVVLWPSADVQRFAPGDTPVSARKHYIITSALTPFKRLDIPVRVLTKLGIPLKIIGSGNQRAELEKIAGPNIEFLGRLSDCEIAEHYKYARGFLMPQKEDAGIAPIEAMAAGLPVFGQGAGGFLEINIDGVTGRFFAEEDDESFEAGFVKFDREVGEGKYDDAGQIVRRASLFGEENFRIKFQEIIEGQMSQ